jgi:hypothetical protein
MRSRQTIGPGRLMLAGGRQDELAVQALMVSRLVVMHDVLADRGA